MHKISRKAAPKSSTVDAVQRLACLCTQRSSTYKKCSSATSVGGWRSDAARSPAFPLRVGSLRLLRGMTDADSYDDVRIWPIYFGWRSYCASSSWRWGRDWFPPQRGEMTPSTRPLRTKTWNYLVSFIFLCLNRVKEKPSELGAF